MQKSEKERVVADLAEQLRAADSLIVADYRGLTNSQLEALRARLRPHGARLTVVKNTLTRRAAEAAGAESLLALLEGPTALAFVAAEGDPVAVAKALADTARETRILALRGGVMQGSPITGDDVEQLAKLPPVDVLQAQLVGVIIAPLTQVLGLLTAPIRDLVGLIDARIAQLEESGAVVVEEAVGASASEPAPEAPVEAEAPVAAEASAEAETEAEEPEVAAGEDASAETAATPDEESE